MEWTQVNDQRTSAVSHANSFSNSIDKLTTDDENNSDLLVSNLCDTLPNDSKGLSGEEILSTNPFLNSTLLGSASDENQDGLTLKETKTEIALDITRKDYEIGSLVATNEIKEETINIKEIKNLRMRHAGNIGNYKADSSTFFIQKNNSTISSMGNSSSKTPIKGSFDCDQCSKTFKFNTGLDRHMQKCHNRRKFQCDDCAMTFDGKALLVCHILTHLGQTLVYNSNQANFLSTSRQCLGDTQVQSVKRESSRLKSQRQRSSLHNDTFGLKQPSEEVPELDLQKRNDFNLVPKMDSSNSKCQNKKSLKNKMSQMYTAVNKLAELSKAVNFSDEVSIVISQLNEISCLISELAFMSSNVLLAFKLTLEQSNCMESAPDALSHLNPSNNRTSALQANTDAEGSGCLSVNNQSPVDFDKAMTLKEVINRASDIFPEDLGKQIQMDRKKETTSSVNTPGPVGFLYITLKKKKKLQCPDCQKFFKTTRNLKRHMLLHNDIRPYECDKCPMTFTRKDRLKVHMSTHFKIRPSTKKQCSYTAKAAKSLKPSQELKEHTQNKNDDSADADSPLANCDGCTDFDAAIEDKVEDIVNLSPEDLDQIDIKKEPAFLGISKNMASFEPDQGDDAEDAGGSYMNNDDCTNFDTASTFEEEKQRTLNTTLENEDKDIQRDDQQKAAPPNPQLEDTILKPEHFLKVDDESGEKKLQCPRCQRIIKTTRSLKGLKRHIMIHNNIRPHTCSQCSQSFTRKDKLNRHMATHSVKRSFACSQCPYTARTAKSLKLHQNIKKHHLDKGDNAARAGSSLVNSNCCTDFNDAAIKQEAMDTIDPIHQNLDKGIKTDEQQKLSSSCTQLENTTLQPKLNMSEGIGEKKLQCPQCQKFFKTNRNLKRHMMGHSDIRPYACDVCPLSFTRKDKLDRHMRIHSIERPFSCSQCSYKAHTASKLEAHAFTHVNRLYACKFCSYTTKRQATLNIHMQRHKDETENPTECDHVKHRMFFCKNCEFSTSSRYKFEYHRRKHYKPKTYFCELCAYYCNSLAKFKYHKLRHENKTPLQCNQCEYKCSSKASLDVHLLKHAGSRPCLCSVCGASFYRSTDLNNHMFIHRKVKPFKCSTCDFRTCNKSNLKEHEMTHTGERRYKCQYCNSSFGRKKALQVHMEKHGPEPEISIEAVTSSLLSPPQLN